MPTAINFDSLVIDRVLDGWFEDKNLNVLACLDQIQNFQISVSSTTKDKTDAQGTLIKRFYTAKQAEITGENAIFSLDLSAIQAGTTKLTGSEVVLPRILQVAKTEKALKLPDVPIDGTLIVYGTLENGVVDTSKKYTAGTEAGENTYAVSTVEGVTTLALPTNATDYVQIKYEYQVAEGKSAARVNHDGTHFPKECKATFRVLCSDVCDSETVRAFYIVFPKFQISPDFSWTVDTESAQPFTATAFKDYCAKEQILFYIAIAEDSDIYDAVQPTTLEEVEPSVLSDVTVEAEAGTTSMFGTLVSDMQSDVAIANNAITGTLNELTSGALVDYWGPGHFIALKFSDLDPAATSVKVGLDPSQGSGLVEIITDPDKNGAFKITDKDAQVFKVVSTDGVTTKTQTFDLSGLTLA
jgi:hypothetical protein